MAISPELSEYIRQQTQQGTDKESIKAALRVSGWQENDITEGMSAAANTVPTSPVHPPEQNPANQGLGTNLIAALVHAMTALFFVLIGNFLYVGIFAIFVIKGSVSPDSGPTIMSTLLSIIIPVVMVWLGVLSSRSYIQKRYPSCDVDRVVIYSSIFFAVIMFVSLYSSLGGADTSTNTLIAMIRVMIISATFYFLGRHYLKSPISSASSFNAVTVDKPQEVTYKNIVMRLISRMPTSVLSFVVLYTMLLLGMSGPGTKTSGITTTTVIMDALGIIFIILCALKGVDTYKKSQAKNHGKFYSAVFNWPFFLILIWFFLFSPLLFLHPIQVFIEYLVGT